MRQTKLAWTVLAVTVAVIGVVAVTAMLRSPFSGNGSDPPPAGAEDEGAAAAGDDARAGENDAGAGEAEGKDGAAAGEALFQSQGCGQCHYTDRTENKIGPGLKGLMDRETLSLSGWPATRENVRRQIVDPYDSMPSYEDRLDDAALGRLLDYLATL
jgi:mono/diheme cytochrome c family protein